MTSPEPRPPAPDVRDPRQEVPYGLRVGAWWSLCLVAIVLGLYVLVRLLSSVSVVTITLAVAVMVTALLEPAVRGLVRRGVPRPLAAIGVFVVGIAALALSVWFVFSQVTGASGDLGEQLRQAGDDIRDWLVTGPLQLSPQDVDGFTTSLDDTLRDNRGAIVNGVLQTASSALGAVSGAVLCLFAVLFLMLDDGTIWRWSVRLLPAHNRTHAQEGGVVAWRTLTVYMRSLVLLAALNALAMVPVMLVAGLDLVVPLAVLLFLGSLVPLIGVLVAGAVVCLVALVTEGPTTAVVMAVAMVLVVQLFGNLLNPIILGKAVDIHPLAILVCVTGGTLLAGIFGAFVAVPLVAVVNNVVHAVRRHHRSLPPPDASPPGASRSGSPAVGPATGPGAV